MTLAALALAHKLSRTVAASYAVLMRATVNMDSTAKIRPISSALPIEILLKIFNTTTWRTGEVEQLPDRFASNRALASSALVCKSWLAPAREVLYTSIYLANVDIRTSTRNLLRTLSDSPAWQPASMVRAITFDVADYRASDAMSDFAKIIELCGPENLRTLRIGRYHHGPGLSEMRNAMMNAVHLQKLVIAPPGNTYKSRYVPFATTTELFQIVQCYPELREIGLEADVLDKDEYEESEPSAERRATVLQVSFPLKPGMLPHFKRFSDRRYLGSNFEARHLLALLQLAPNLSTLKINYKVIFSRPGIAVLEALSQSLTELHLASDWDVEGFDVFGADVAAALAPAPVLRHLKTSSACMPPGAFSDPLSFPALEKLEYELDEDTNIDVLTDALRSQPRRIPMLKELTLTKTWDYGFAEAECLAEGSYEALKEACLHRAVRLKEDYGSDIEETAAFLGVPAEEQFNFQPG
ncbi:hypothetical protein FA95DRAFT_1680207 [Auriscalpium vulgare]|uniref:Uncharacterized protein n=1 Tax=Auriscalpium vulgare TaxID=40419 RepID=A0ACB8RNN0_9AGAM|nr:hypothetical protein FA95DRAFT_1680207 [Auriscalpium vulgare]